MSVEQWFGVASGFSVTSILCLQCKEQVCWSASYNTTGFFLETNRKLKKMSTRFVSGSVFVVFL